MKKYVNVLDDVICLDEIRKIKIAYNNGYNYEDKLLHCLFITYKDGTKEKYHTTDLSEAKDFENLKSALLEIDTDHPTEKGGEG